jgi:hypothetical protein
MTVSVAAKIVAGTLLLSFSAAQLAQADGSQPSAAGQQTLSCRQMMDKARAMAARTPAGVEKMAAQKEIASARTDLQKGAETQCQTHIHNAMEALKAHSTN